MANLHEFMDRFPMVVSSVFPKYFRAGVESPSVWEHIQAVRLDMPDVLPAGDHKVQVHTIAGEVSALVRVIPSVYANAPVIIYHHGAKEFDTSFKGIFGKKPDLAAHLVLVRAPFHENFKTFLFGISSLTRYLAMYAVSARVIEEVIAQFRLAGCGNVSVSGTSLGGFISLVHLIHFGSADAYIPMLAGPNLAHCLLESAYSRQTGKAAKAKHEYVTDRLDFSSAYRLKNPSNVYPLLGQYDQIVVPAVNTPAYGAAKISYIERGHFTGSTSFQLLREHILSVALAEQDKKVATK